MSLRYLATSKSSRVCSSSPTLSITRIICSLLANSGAERVEDCRRNPNFCSIRGHSYSWIYDSAIGYAKSSA